MACLSIKCNICYASYTLGDMRVFPVCGVYFLLKVVTQRLLNNHIFLLSGHGMCAGCVDGTTAFYLNKGVRRPPCHMCRTPFDPAQVIQLFLQTQGPSDASTSSQSQAEPVEVIRWRGYSAHVETQAKHLGDCIGNIGQDSEVSSVKRMGREIRKVVDAMKDDRKEVDVVQVCTTFQYVVVRISSLPGPLRRLYSEP